MNGSHQPPQVRGIRRVVYVALAMLFLALGLVGVVLPGVPTTPFLLLMSYSLVRSSPWLHDRVVRLPVVGRPIREWREERGIRLHIKLIASFMVCAVVGGSLWSRSIHLPFKAAIVVLAALGLGVVWRLPTIRTR